MSEPPTTAYKVLTADQMGRFCREGIFAGSPLDLADGYIHLSSAEQLAETLDKHFAGQAELHIAAVDLTMLGPSISWEPSRGGQLFPHVYAVLPFDAVVAHGPLSRDANGRILLPERG